MAMRIPIEKGVPLDKSKPDFKFEQSLSAAAETAALLADAGLVFYPDEDDKETAKGLSHLYAEDPVTTAEHGTLENVTKMTPASLLLVKGVLEDWGHRVVEDSMHIRHLVTNRLIVESDNADPKIRLRALEMLGKLSDVGAFTDKSEVTVTHRSTDELREGLRAKLARLAGSSRPSEPPEDAVILDGEAISLDDTLGLSQKTE